MKKISSLLLVVILCGLLVIPALAAPAEPQITLQPQNYTYPQYGVAVYTVKLTGTNLHATWYLEYEGKTYNLSDNSNGIEPWESYAGETYGPMEEGPNTFSWFFGGIEAGLNGAEIWCVIEDGHYDVTSARAIITVQGDVLPPEILQMPPSLTVNQGAEAEVRCVAKTQSGGQLSFQWYETSTGKLQDIRAIDGEECDFLLCSTKEIGTRYYVCCVTETNGGRAYSSVLPVTVTAPTAPPVEETVITTETLPEAVAGESYSATIAFTGADATIAVSYNPGAGNDFEKTGLTLSADGKLSGVPKTPGTYEFAVCAAGAGGEDYGVFKLVVNAPAENPTETTAQTQPETEATEPEATDAFAEDSAPTTMPVQTTGQAEKDPEPSDDGISWWMIGVVAVVALGTGAGAAVLLLKKKG